MSVGMWIGLIVGGLGALIGLSVGVGSVLTLGGSNGIYIAAGIILIFGGMFYLFYKLMFAPMILANRLQKVGLPGKATIKEVHDTGVTVNNSPQVKLVLEIKNSFGQIYTTTIRTLVSRLQPNLYEVGMVVPVLIDPKDENRVVIDYSGGKQATAKPAYSQSQVNQLQEELGKLQREGDAVRLTGKSAKAIIKKYTWLNAYVNGNNPYAELEIEVLPDDAPAFSATVRGAIGEQAVAKYQAGNTIYVKYDAYDKSKVALDHS